jgi:hypothetical protein
LIFEIILDCTAVSPNGAKFPPTAVESGALQKCSKIQGLTFVGEWLSLVEHLVRDQGVGGSNPLSPTNLVKHLQQIHLGATSAPWVQVAIWFPDR